MGIKFSKVSLGAGLDSCSFFLPGHLDDLERLRSLPQYRIFCREHPAWNEIEVEIASFWFGEDHSSRESFKDADTDHLLLMASFGTLYGGWRDDPATYPLVCAGSTYHGMVPNTENIAGKVNDPFSLL